MDEQTKQRKADILAGEILQLAHASLLLHLRFTGAERALILPARVETPDNARFGSSGGNAAEDRLFLLSVGEAFTP